MQFTRDIPTAETYDLVVCGGGPAGCAAAVAARRAGLRVLLVEGQGQLGGTGTSGLVAHWLGGRRPDGQWVVGGLFRQWSERAAAEGVALLPVAEPGQKYTPHGWHLGLAHGVPYDPFAMAAMLDTVMAEEGVEVLLATQAVDVVRQGDRLTHAVLFNKGGLAAVGARAFVDATGDADLAARSGCAVVKGDAEGLTTPVTLEFHLDNVDQDALARYIHQHESPRFRELIAQLRAKGDWPFPYEIFISVQLTEPGTMMINTPRTCGIDGTDGASLSDGYRRGRQEIATLLPILRKHFPGFAQARLKAVAPLLGVRETRRIVGPYVLTVADVVEGRRFDDTVGYSMYGWDLPDPRRPSHQPHHEKGTRIRGGLTPIPYRILVPAPVENLICPGRAVSVERDVLGPLRVMAPVMAMGQAAGIAAGQVVRNDTAFAAVDTDALREQLRADGAILDMHHDR